MKIGAENKTKTYIAVGLMVLGLLLVVRTFLPILTAAQPQETASATPPPPTAPARRSARRRGPGGRSTVAVLSPTLDPRLRTDLLKESEEMKYQGSGRNIFRAEAEPASIPKPITSPVNPNSQPVAQGPPPPPPIPLRFFGFANKPGEAKKVFLADGEDVFVAGIGDVVDRRYKITKIGVNSVEIQDVLNNNTQTIPLSQG